MQMTKRFLALVLCLVMCFTMVPVQARAAEAVVQVEHGGAVTTYASLQAAFDGIAAGGNNSYGGKYVVTLLGDTTGVNKTLTYPTEALDITLDLNGHTITGAGTTYAVIFNVGSKVSGIAAATVTIKDSSGDNSGKITGGTGGVKVDGAGAILNFESGTITENHGASKGGGIMMGATAKLVMTGGVITKNSVTGTSSANSGYGGGVLANYADILGGIITENVAYAGTHAQTGRGGGVATEITRTSGYSTLTIADGVVFGNTAENAGDDLMAQGNGQSTVKFTLKIGTENWFIDGWNGTKATTGNGETDRYNEESPVEYTDGGFENAYNISLGLKYYEDPYDGPIYQIIYTDGVDDVEVFADQVYKGRPDKTTPAFKGTPERTGYKFEGWSPEVPEKPTSDMTFTAQWTALPAYTVTYTDGVEGEEIFADQVHDTYEGYETPDFVGTPSREHYIFEGWSPAVSDIVTATVTYVAIWREAVVYTITYTDGVEGEEIFPDQVFWMEEQQATPTYTFTGSRPGFYFNGWMPSVAKTVTANATYTAKWTACSHTDWGTPVFDEEALTNTYTCVKCGQVKVVSVVAEINGNYFESLQAALSTVKNGTVTVKLLADTTENITYTWASSTLNRTLDLTIDLNGHTLTGTGTGSVMTFKRSGTSINYKWNLIIDDTSAEKTGTITGGNGTSGGAITVSGVKTNDSLTIKGGNFKNNTASGNGGAIYASASGYDVTIEGGVFEENTAASGGAIYATMLYINGGTFKNNTASNATYGGGAIYATNTLTIAGGTITGNTATNGGGIYVTASKPIVNITGGKIYGNTATGYGDDIVFKCSGSIAPTLNLLAAADMEVDGITNWYVDGYYGSAKADRYSETVALYVAPSALTKSTIALKAASHYTITYVDGVEDEVIFEDHTVLAAPGGKTPEFTPEREGYTFLGWTPEVAETVTGDATYTAQWKENAHGEIDGVTFRGDNEGLSLELNNVLAYESIAIKVYSGDTLLTTVSLRDMEDAKQFLGTTQDALTVSIRTYDESTYWVATEWIPYDDTVPNKYELYIDGVLTDTCEDTVDLEGWNNLIGTQLPNYTVIYTDGVDDEEIFADQSYTVVKFTETPAFEGTPVREGYEFLGWTPAVAEAVTGNVTYVAQWRVAAHGVINGVTFRGDNEGLSLELHDLLAYESIAIKVYSGEKLLTTVSLRDMEDAKQFLGTEQDALTVSIRTYDESTYWAATEWLPLDDTVPNKYELYIDGVLMDTCEDTVDTAGWNALIGTKDKPAMPDKYGANVTPALIQVVCDSDPEHEPMDIKWQHQSTAVYHNAQIVWNEELEAWTVKVKIDSVSTYYVWMHYQKSHNNISHTMVDGDQQVIITDLKWDEENQLWVHLDEKPIEVHVTCTTVPVAPTNSWMGRKSFQIQVLGDLDGDGIYGENGLLNDGIYELYATTIPADAYTIGEVYGSRKDGFFVDVTVTLEDGDIFLTNWIEKRVPGEEYIYNWEKTSKTFTFTMQYTGDLTTTLQGDGINDWVNAATGEGFGKIGEAYVIPAMPEAPQQSNVTDKLVSVICDSDGERHETVYGKWYPLGHCTTTSDIVWNEELGAWSVDVRIGSLTIMYVDQLEDANDGTMHELVDDITTVYTTLKWDLENKQWVPVEAIELHTTCRTAPLAPVYNQLKSYQIKIWGDLKGEQLAYVTNIPENGYTLSEVYGSREEGFFVDLTVTLEDGDAFITNWIEKRAPGEAYSYNWDKTEKTVTIKLKYNGSLTGTLYGNRHAANVNYDWVLISNGKTYGVVSEAYAIPSMPAAPQQSNVTEDLVTVICDSDAGRHEPVTGKWYPQHCSTTSDMVWNEELHTWTVDIRIGALYIMYVDQLEDANGGTTHTLVDDITTVYSSLKWDLENEQWIPVEAIELHTTCRTAPLAPSYNQLQSYQVKVWGNVDGEQKAYTTSIPEGGYTLSEVYGSREEGFFVDVTFTLEDGDVFITTWIEKRAPGEDLIYNWAKTEKTVTFTLKYNGSLTGTLRGDRHAVNTNYDWIHAETGEIFAVVSEAYVIPAMPAAPQQSNVTENLVSVICDSDGERHETVTGKWYPQHCSTTADMVWSDELGTWTVDIRIGALYIMYVDQLEDANGGTIHTLVDDITTVYSTLKWDAENELWIPVEAIELHTTCRTAPLAPVYDQLKSYQVKVWGEFKGEQEAYTTGISENGYTLSEVYGSREEGFFVDVTFTLADGDAFISKWIEQIDPCQTYVYDWTKTEKTVTFTLKYNGSLTGTLHGNRHASNTNYDWVLETNGKHYGVVSEANVIVDVNGETFHDCTSVVTEPTCTEGGYTTHTCTVCGHTYQDTFTDPNGHTGEEGENCSVCGTYIPYTQITILTQPTAQAVKIGETAVFSVTATGEELKYQWEWRANANVAWANAGAAGNKTATLNVPGTKDRNGYEYRCKITDAYDNVEYTDGVILTVKTTLAVTTQPTAQTVTVGQTAKFTVAAVGDGLKYQWEWRPNASTAWANAGAAGNKTATLNVPGTKDRNGYEYRCKITDAYGTVIYTNGVILTVKTTLAVTTQPTAQTVTVGQTAKFTVVAVGDGLKYQWEWRPNASTAWANAGAAGNKTATLNVPGTLDRNGYEYRCKITDAYGTVIYTNGVILTVKSNFAITTQPTAQTVTVGQTAKFTVAATGDGLKYQWEWRPNVSTAWANAGAAGNKTATLNVPGTPDRNGYEYRCKITDIYGAVIYTNGVILTVKSNLAITTQPVAQTVDVGQAAKFTVVATGDSLTYQWQWRINSGDSWKNSPATGNKTATLTVPGTLDRNGYEYRCVIVDAYGAIVTTDVVKLTVKNTLTITAQPADKTVTVGQSAQFAVTATGDSLTYQWQWRANSNDSWKNSPAAGNKTATLTVPGTLDRNGYEYRCVIIDAYGTIVISNTAKLTVKTN